MSFSGESLKIICSFFHDSKRIFEFRSAIFITRMFCIIGKKDVPLYETNLGIIKVP